ncbi:cell division protein FtsL [Ideonella sp.]|uniref:cell division protein FtsL n=1 Tax=Ideonella sp. TaxID=1929293 RepID=UPI002B47BF60|nr:cell division protein FtsL [Ideonella sp.]HJV69170.1 cell division protein FtsL [Ideonella sp.]
MTRLSVLLLVALVASGLFLVKTSYESRRLFAEIERAKAEEAQLAADAKRLDAERRTEATHLKVERTAREKLAMRLATPDVTVYVQDTRASEGVRP